MSAIPPLPACGPWLCPRTIPITLRSSRILGAAGHDDEARHWRRLAAALFDELIASHPAAFADHAAEFWLAAGADPVKGLRLARMNVEVRKTPRSRRLLTQAALANAGH